MKIIFIALQAVTNAVNFQQALKNNQVYALSELAMQVSKRGCDEFINYIKRPPMLHKHPNEDWMTDILEQKTEKAKPYNTLLSMFGE